MEELSTHDLIRKAAAGNAGAFSALVDQYYMTVYKMAYKCCGKREDAEDIAQEVFVKLPEKLSGYRFESAFTSWLYAITLNTSRDLMRKAGKTHARELPFAEGFDAASDEPGAEAALAARQAYASIHELPPPVRDAVLLVYGEDMNHKEAAKVLGCAETTVSWRIFQARKQLKHLRAS